MKAVDIAKSYITDRTTMWRSRNPEKHFIETIDKIEVFGCYNISVFSNSGTLGFTYSTGIFDASQKPEIITVGLSPDTAHHVIMYAFELMESGTDLSLGRHADLLGNVDCEFRPVDPKWLHHTMLRTNWYYEGADVPVLQLVYPDLENRFEGENGFDNFFAQPDLRPDVPFGKLEQDLWNMTT